MNKDKLKMVNWVGVGAAVLAFICVFLPFCQAKVIVYGYSVTQDSCNFLSYNLMGILFMLAIIAAGVLYFLAGYKENKQYEMFALIASAAALVFLILALVIGNSDIKDLQEIYSYVTISYTVGMYFEFILAIVMVAAKWIDELIVKKYLFKDNKVIFGNAPQQGQYMNQQAQQQGQYMNQQAPQQGQYMNQQAQQQGQYMNQQAPQQDQNNNL